MKPLQVMPYVADGGEARGGGVHVTGQARGRWRGTTLGRPATVMAIEWHEQSEPQQHERVGSFAAAEPMAAVAERSWRQLAATRSTLQRFHFGSTRSIPQQRRLRRSRGKFNLEHWSGLSVSRDSCVNPHLASTSVDNNIVQRRVKKPVPLRQHHAVQGGSRAVGSRARTHCRRARRARTHCRWASPSCP